MKVLIFADGVLSDSMEWERPLLNQRRSALLQSNPAAFNFMRGLRTRANKRDRLSPVGKTLALNYLDLVLSPNYTESAEGRRDYVSATATKQSIVEALQEAGAGMSLDQLCRKVFSTRERVQSAVSQLRRKRTIAYALGSRTSCPLFCLADSEDFLGYSIEDCSADRLVRDFLKRDGQLTSFELATLTGYSTQMCRTVANDLVKGGEARIVKYVGFRKTAIYKLIDEEKQKCA